MRLGKSSHMIARNHLVGTVGSRNAVEAVEISKKDGKVLKFRVSQIHRVIIPILSISSQEAYGTISSRCGSGGTVAPKS